ncbi:CHAP domain-containing protein [Sphingomonas sp. Leaf10]|uniref:CHAP domain-containing protein n=1 Tax=Sphingomonas sp. Leaf10 TaxID=1735676 RepID=UPI0006F41CD4|nr:CHAP domain-containing protein [Sphingomonas sp. Leaf10]KQM41411.1 amidase [Sphingomonas sp. Leaf10]
MFGSLVRGILLLAFAAIVSVPVGARSLLDYVGQCVPFARAASGIEIYGDAWTWWDQAEGRYPRGHKPKVGAVLAFTKTDRLPLGHVLVISRVVEPRVAMVTHANWSRINGVRGGVEQDVTVFDVSAKGDWTRVKVWYRDTQGLGGSEYPTHGFIYGPSPAVELSGKAPDYVGSLIDAYAR